MTQLLPQAASTTELEEGSDATAMSDDAVRRPDAERVATGPSGREQGRLHALDGLRLLAALVVMCFHWTAVPHTTKDWGVGPRDLFPTLSQYTIYGNLGVELFFVISGFVICMSTWGRSLGDFFRSRVARLYPAYWVAVLLVTAASFVLPVVQQPLRLDEVLVNLSMLQQPFGTPRVIGVDWTLWVEARFYLLFGLFVVWRGVTYRRVVAFAMLWLVAAVVGRGLNEPVLNAVVMPEWAPFFCGGLALYLVHRYGSDLLLWGVVGVSWVLGQNAVVRSLWKPPGTKGVYIERQEIWLVVGLTLCYALVAAVALGWFRFARWRWLTVAGALTYPFYLIHEHLGWFWIRVLRRYFHLPVPLVLLVTAASMLTLAWLIHRYVERPLGPRLKRALAAQAAAIRLKTAARP